MHSLHFHRDFRWPQKKKKNLKNSSQPRYCRRTGDSNKPNKHLTISENYLKNGIDPGACQKNRGDIVRQRFGETWARREIREILRLNVRSVCLLSGVRAKQVLHGERVSKPHGLKYRRWEKKHLLFSPVMGLTSTSYLTDAWPFTPRWCRQMLTLRD